MILRMHALRHRLAACAFPPGERRDELIGTLGESAEALSLREAAEILWHGARARLGRPKSRFVVPFALVIMIFGAFAGGVAATRLAWTLVPPLPDGERAAQISGTVFPGLRVYGGGDVPDFVAEPDADGDLRNGYVTYVVTHTDATRDVAVYAAGARDRLAAAGWAVHDLPDYAFWAEHDGLVLDFRIWYWAEASDYDSDGGAYYQLSRSTPDWVWWAAPAGAPIGALLAFLTFGWVSRRTAHAGMVVPVLSVVYLLALWHTAVQLPWMVSMWWRPDPETPPVRPFWWPLFGEFAEILTYPVLLWTVVALLLAAFQRPLPLLLRPKWRIAGLAGTGVALIAAGAVWAVGAARPCDPDGIPAPPAGAQARASTKAHVYLDPAHTVQQREVIQAAIGKGGGGALIWHPQSPAEGTTEFEGCGTSTPWFEVWHVSHGTFPRLTDQVSPLPGVLLVQQAP